MRGSRQTLSVQKMTDRPHVGSPAANEARSCLPQGRGREALQVLLSRHVVREHTGQRAGDSDLDLMLEAMLAAPTASNNQA